MNNKTLTFFGVIGSIFVGAILFYLLCLNHVSINEIGVQFNSLNGELKVQKEPGWYVTSPFVKAISLSTVPMIVHVPSNAKVINTKVVKIKSENVLSLVKIQGFGYDLGSGLENLLMGYAFSGQTFSFLEIIQEGSLETAQ